MASRVSAAILEVPRPFPHPEGFSEIDRYLSGEELRVGWARDAWEDDHAREFLTNHMAEDVARGGDSWNRPDWIEQLDLSLNRDQVVELYVEIRDRSGRPERDWRPAFESRLSRLRPAPSGPVGRRLGVIKFMAPASSTLTSMATIARR